jgi:hypothetical protein
MALVERLKFYTEFKFQNLKHFSNQKRSRRRARFRDPKENHGEGK